MLPGLGDSEHDFVSHGFIRELRIRKLSVDTIRANAMIGYYSKNTLRDRIDADFYLEARKHYEQVWFVGISLGGLGSLLMAQRHGLDIAGMLLLAPYLGEDVVDEIVAAGGLARWQPPAAIAKDDYEHELWAYIKTATAHPEAAPAIYLASGDQDRFGAGHRMLAPLIPAERRFRVRGEHDWGPWFTLWVDFLDHSDFAARCADHSGAPS